ncbi:TonB-dependent receptor [Pasteurellaceae bacterium Pebbles2]|nr:TonB-dependent receptor [Pasteurellaceae bacterium Pebbles2]
MPLAALVAFSVQAQTETLDLIDVVAEHTGAKSKTNVVTLNDLNRRTKEDLRGVLSAEPSINFGGGNGGTSQWTTIRGMGQDQIDLKVDNVYSDAQFFHHQSRFIFDPSLIKRIDVRKGAGSASAGIGATSGSIEATTVDAKDLLRDGQDFGFKLNAGVSSNKGHSQGATVYGKAGAFDALVSGNWDTEENYKGGKGYTNLDGKNTVENSALGQRGLLAKLGWDLSDDQRLVLSHRQERYHGERALREEFDFTQSYAAAARNTDLKNGQSLSNVFAGRDRRGNNTYYILDRNGNYVPNYGNNDPRYRITTQNTTNLEWTGKNMGFVSEAKANLYRMEISRDDAGTKAKILTTGANVNFDSAIGDSHFVKYGVNVRKQEGKPAQLAAGAHNQEKLDTGVYVEGIWGFGPVTWTTGARYDHFDFTASNGKKVSGGDFNPSTGLIWEATKDLSFNANLNFASRSPRFYEVAIAGAGAVSVADDLRAEKARNTEIGFNYNFSDSISLNGSYFWQKVKNAHSLLNRTVIYNGALLRNQGYELGAAYKYDGFKARLGVADSTPEVYGSTADNTVFAVATGRTWTAGLSYTFAQPDLELGWRGRFVESETGTPSRGSSGGESSVKQAGYGVNDFYASWKANQNLTVNVAVNNAFNKSYKSHSQRAGVNSLTAAGRDFRLNVAYTF